MKPAITVVTCTYNPRPDHLARTLTGLRLQTLPSADWEYLLVDNNSMETLSTVLAWHPRARLVSEPKPGKIHALLRAVHEAQGDLLVIVDDDNVLSPDFLKKRGKLQKRGRFWVYGGGRLCRNLKCLLRIGRSPTLAT